VATPREGVEVKRLVGTRGWAAVILSVTAVVAVGAGSASASAATAPVTKTFSFIGKPGALPARTLFNIDGFSANARCDSKGSPIVFGFSSASNADLFGRLFDGLLRTHIIKNSAFTKGKSVALYPSTNDFDTTGALLFETSTGKVVTVQYAMDNSTTLNHTNVCTVYGSLVAT
jgi:hypothetical protein